jgi:FtsZ-binding cell division protein ZapB
MDKDQLQSMHELIDELSHLSVDKTSQTKALQDKLENMEKNLNDRYSNLVDRLSVSYGMNELHKDETFLKFQSRVHERIDKIQDRLENIEERQKTFEVKGNTIIAGITVVWILFASIFSWVWEKSTSKVEGYIDQINITQSQMKDLKVSNDTLVSEINQLKATKSQVLTFQQDLERLQEQVYNKK